MSTWLCYTLRQKEMSDAVADCGELNKDESSPVSELSFRLQSLDYNVNSKPVLTLDSPMLQFLSKENQTPTGSDSESLSPQQIQLQVRCSRFPPGPVEPEAALQYQSDLTERGQGDVDSAIVGRFRRLMSRHKSPAPTMTEDDLSDLTLLGDFSKQHLLPVESVENWSLHCVSVHTVASLIRGHFGAAVENFLIIDCRYPYEYQGGHIKGAVNLYTESQISQALQQASGQSDLPLPSTTFTGSGHAPRKLLVFHCEFSSERGPRLCQYLRRLDRRLNASVYPHLYYPELYLMQGGYRLFHACYPDLCDPFGYVSMRHRKYQKQLLEFRRSRTNCQWRQRPIRKLQK